MLAAVAQSNYPLCVYTVPIRAAGFPVWTQGCVDNCSINTSLQRFFISLDLKKKKKLRARNVVPHRGFSFLSLFLSRYKALWKAKALLFL